MAAADNERMGGARGGEARACAGEARAGAGAAEHSGDGGVAVAVRAAAADAARARESEQAWPSECGSEMGRGASHFGCRRPWRGPLARHRRPRGTAARRRRARGAPSLWPVGHDARGARGRTDADAGDGPVWAKFGLPVRAGLFSLFF